MGSDSVGLFLSSRMKNLGYISGMKPILASATTGGLTLKDYSLQGVWETIYAPNLPIEAI
jgi:hypothetical protein